MLLLPALLRNHAAAQCVSCLQPGISYRVIRLRWLRNAKSPTFHVEWLDVVLVALARRAVKIHGLQCGSGIGQDFGNLGLLDASESHDCAATSLSVLPISLVSASVPASLSHS
jgi:hypothetical protein